MLRVIRYGSIGSTMDVAKELIDAFPTGCMPTSEAPSLWSNPSGAPLAVLDVPLLTMPHPTLNKHPFAVVADEQTKGRATNQRRWASSTGNLYMSLVVPNGMVPGDLMPVLPLYVGLKSREGIVAAVQGNTTAISMSSRAMLDDQIVALRLKWPNDVLGEGGRKMMGVLIESHKDYFVIGIGANVMSAPSQESVTALDAREGRVPGCLVEHFTPEVWKSSAVDLSKEISKAFLNGLVGYADGLPGITIRQDVVRNFTKHMDFKAALQKRVEKGNAADPKGGGLVMPLGLNDWGLLEVRHVDSGRKETLSAEYLL